MTARKTVALQAFDVVLIDDNEDLLELYREMLEKENIQVKTFLSGSQAIDWLDNPANRARLVLLDLSMPSMDGLSVAQEIRQNERVRQSTRPIKIAFLTACTVDSPILDVAYETNIRKIFLKDGNFNNFISDVKELIKNE